ncbi:hypothetical protein ACFLWA_11865, partial [Chloroflexota bacterium]
LCVDAVRRAQGGTGGAVAGEPTVVPGSIPIRLEGQVVGSFGPTDLDVLGQTSFVDAEESKIQEGWLLSDVILLHVEANQIESSSPIVVISSSRGRSAELDWSEVEDPANHVILDMSGRGTLKLVSTLERLDTRDEWVQDVDSIEIEGP